MAREIRPTAPRDSLDEARSEMYAAERKLETLISQLRNGSDEDKEWANALQRSMDGGGTEPHARAEMLRGLVASYPEQRRSASRARNS